MLSLRICSTRSLVVVMLSGWREQGVQVVDLKTRKVTQKLLQDGAFYGAAFSPDGHRLCVSGGNTDMLFIYAWKDGVASLENQFELSKAKTVDEAPFVADLDPGQRSHVLSRTTVGSLTGARHDTDGHQTGTRNKEGLMLH
jgi:hypothetical protein